MVDQHQRHHGLYHGHGARQHAGVVSTLAAQGGLFAGAGDRVLFAADGGGGLEGDAQHDRLAVGDTALDAAGPVGGGAGAAVGASVERVVVLVAGEQGARKAGADLERLAGRQRHQRLGQVRFEFVEHRRAPAGGHVACHALHHPADAVARLANLIDERDHLLGHSRIRAAYHVRLHVGRGHRLGVHRGRGHILDRPDVGHNLHPRVPLQHFSGHRTRGHSPDGLSRRRPPAAGHRPNAVLGVVGGVRVRRPIPQRHGVVVSRTLVLVAHQHGYGRAGGQPVDHTRQNLRVVVLGARRRQPRLARTSPPQLALHVLLAQRQPRRTAVDHHAHPGACDSPTWSPGTAARTC
eukprot:ctg_323.g136